MKAVSWGFSLILGLFAIGVTARLLWMESSACEELETWVFALWIMVLAIWVKGWG